MKLFKKKDKDYDYDLADDVVADKPQMAKMPVQHRKQKRMSLRQLFVPSVAKLCSNQL